MLEDKSLELLIFASADNHYAVQVEEVQRVMRIVETTSIPDSPFILFGIFNLQGTTLPVISARRLFCLDEKPVELEDMFIILRVGKQQIALLTDSVLGVFICPKEKTTQSDALFPGLIQKGIVQWGESLVAVIDMERQLDSKIFKHVEQHLLKEDKEA